MRTKHVLMTTALMAMFAACTNDEFISNEQGVQGGDAALRPQVDVTLNVLGDGDADTRLSYNGQYKFDDGEDVIGALLMDKLASDERPFDDLEKWNETPWLQRYELVDYINTDYPFNRNNGQWSTDAKMLEGNYFFAFPFASYEGYREAVHSIGEQIQEGQDVAKAYADNQFFIGYSRIHAGTEGGEVMSANLELVPVLGTLGVQVKNVGTGEMTVKKIVLTTKVEEKYRAYGLSTLIKIDPTDAMYTGSIDGATNAKGYILDNEKIKWAGEAKQNYFNYANYEEMKNVNGEWEYIDKFEERYAPDGDLVNNTKKSLNYNRREALRAVVKGVSASDQRAELTIENSPVLKSQEYANFAIMTNIYEYNKDAKNEIYAYVYTDKGMVGPVSLYDVKTEIGATNPTTNGLTVISNNPVVKINPNHKITVALSVDNNSVQGPQSMDIYNEDDLAQFIEWSKNLQRVNTATLKKDITLTKEMGDMLTADEWGKNTFIIKADEGKKLVIAEDAATNVMDYMIADCDVEVLGNLVLGTKSFVNGVYNTSDRDAQKSYEVKEQQLTVAEGASLTVASPITYETTGDYQKQELIIAENEGTVTINANAEVERLQIAENKADVTINANVTFVDDSKNMENATITIGKGAIVSAAGKLTNEGRNEYGTNNDDNSDWAVIYNNGQINNLTNGMDGKVIAGQGSTTNVDKNEGEIDKSADIKAVVSVKNGVDRGVISYTVKSKMALKDIIDSKITKLVIDGGSVEGTAWGISVPTTSYTASDVKWIEIKGQGGSLGTEIVKEGTKVSHFPSQFPSVEEITTSANATFADIDFTNSDKIAFNIKGATTRIEGTVNAKTADIVLGSYDERNYKGINATLNIPTTTDNLYANSIKEVDGHDQDITSTVMNQGYVQLPNGKTNTDVDKGEGVEVGKKPTDKPGAGDAQGNYTVSDFTILATDLATKDFKNVKKVTYNVSGVPTAEQYKDLVTLFAGRDVVLKTILDLTNGDGTLTMNKLTVDNNGREVKIGDGNQNSRKVMMTVNSLEVTSGTKLTVNESWILITGSARVGTHGSVTNNGTINFDNNGGAIVTQNQANPNGAYLMYKSGRGFVEESNL